MTALGGRNLGLQALCNALVDKYTLLKTIHDKILILKGYALFTRLF